MTGPINQQVLNTPSKPTDTGAATGRSQKDRRYNDTFFDQHRTAIGGRFPNGRPWCGPRELAANREAVPPPPDGFVIPDLMRGEYVETDVPGICDRAATFASVWDAPWTPLPKFFRFNYTKKRITFDYERMRVEENNAIDEYYQAAAILGAEFNVKVEYRVLPSFQITARLGKPSKYLPVVEAAMAGDPWLLGFIDEPNMDLAKILGFNRSGMKVVSYDPQPIVTPAQVIATPQPELMALLERLTAQVTDLARESAERKKKDDDKMERMRAAKKEKRAS